MRELLASGARLGVPRRSRHLPRVPVPVDLPRRAPGIRHVDAVVWKRHHGAGDTQTIFERAALAGLG
ncbi:MAG: hypothetical protein ACRDXF_07260, partial [Acidimicrobiia bacterium]